MMPIDLYYHTARPGGAPVVATSPEALRDFIRDEAGWSPGTSTIIAAPTLKLSPESPGVRWGEVVKHPDGRVELIPVTAD
jgi:hypothetical protein